MTSTMPQNLQNNNFTNFGFIPSSINNTNSTNNFTNFEFIPSSINNSSPTSMPTIENPSINENIPTNQNVSTVENTPETQNTATVETAPENTEQPDTLVANNNNNNNNTNPVLYDDLLNVLYKNSELNRRGNITINEQTFEDGTLVFKKDDIIIPNYKGNSTLVYPVDYTYESNTTKLDPKLVQDSIVLLEQVKQKITDSTKQITV